MLNVLNKYRCFAGLALILVAAALLPGCSGDNGNSLPFNSLSSNSLDGTGAAARFNGPYGITSDGTNLYVADRSNHTIRQVVISTGVVTTLAGTAGTLGTTDGTGATARFNLPSGITTDGTNLYVTDTGNHTLRKIVISTGVVTTIAGSAGISGIIDATIGTDARFNLPSGITTDGTNIYVADTGNHTLRKVAISSGAVTTIAGAAGQPGVVDGIGTPTVPTKFSSPSGITTDGTNLYLADKGNNSIRQVVISSAMVTTIAGPTAAPVAGATNAGSTDGTGTVARFSSPAGIITDGTNLYVADMGNNTLRKIVISAPHDVTTLAGAAGVSGSLDGVGTVARFKSPYGIVSVAGNLYVTDSANNTLRTIALDSGTVTTFAGFVK